MRHLHGCNSKFESVVVLRAKLIEKFGEQVPNSISFNVGYYEGQQHSKIWLCSQKDLETMYQKYPSGEIVLWCDGAESDSGNKRKREDSSATASSKREDEVESVFVELKTKQGSKFATPHLRLWARMISSGMHDSLDNPPDIPAFHSTPKRSRESMSSAITGAAKALASALEGTPKASPTDLSCTHTATGVSPSKAVDLRMKNYEQLRYLQQLLDDGILSREEYMEQKQNILCSLRKL